MDNSLAWSQACICGRTFALPQAYSCHRRSCAKAKKRLSSALEKGREILRVKKRRKLEEMTPQGVTGTPRPLAIPGPSLTETLLPTGQQVRFLFQSLASLTTSIVLQIPEPTSANCQYPDQPLTEATQQTSDHLVVTQQSFTVVRLSNEQVEFRLSFTCFVYSHIYYFTVPRGTVHRTPRSRSVFGRSYKNFTPSCGC